MASKRFLFGGDLKKMFMNKLIILKRRLLDSHGIKHELYRPLIYWLYILHPFKRIGRVQLPSLVNMKQILEQLNLNIKDFLLNRKNLETYMAKNIHEYFHYFSSGYGKAFVGKATEHFVSLKLTNFKDGLFIDVASSTSPFYRIVKKMFPNAKVYHQDFIYESGIHGDQIGGNATNLPFEDYSIDLMTLHNSIEHFEGNDDTKFIKECARVLKKGAEVIILPIFLKYNHINYVNPTINPEGLQLDKNAKIIYTFNQSRFMRHYNAKTFEERILYPERRKFKFDLYRIIVSEDFQETIELALALKLTRL